MSHLWQGQIPFRLRRGFGTARPLLLPPGIVRLCCCNPALSRPPLTIAAAKGAVAASAHVGLGSIASHLDVRDAPGMSAMPPIDGVIGLPAYG